MARKRLTGSFFELGGRDPDRRLGRNRLARAVQHLLRVLVVLEASQRQPHLHLLWGQSQRKVSAKLLEQQRASKLTDSGMSSTARASMIFASSGRSSSIAAFHSATDLGMNSSARRSTAFLLSTSCSRQDNRSVS